MNGWEEEALEDVLEALIDYRGKSPKKSEHGIPVISAKVVKSGRILDSIEQTIAPEYYHEWMRRGLPKVGDVVMTTEGPLGEVAQLNSVTVRYALGQRIVTLRGKAGILDNGFLKYLLMSDGIQERLQGRATGSTVSGISQKSLREMKIPLAPLPEQQEIAAILGALDDKIEVNRKASATLEAMARALYRSWFVDFDPVWAKLENRPPAHIPPQTAALFPDSFDDEGLPEGWKTQSLADFMDIKGGTQPPKSEFKYSHESGYVRLVQIRDYETDQHPTFVKDTAGLRRCEGLDVMIGRYGASVGRVCWGMDGVYNVALVKAEPHQIRDREFIRSVCLSYEFQEYIQAISGRSAQAGFNKSDIAAFDLCIGTDAIRKAFATNVEPLRVSQLALRTQNQTLAALRDSLLPRLMSGELRVGAAREQMEGVL